MGPSWGPQSSVWGGQGGLPKEVIRLRAEGGRATRERALENRHSKRNSMKRPRGKREGSTAGT